MIRDAISNEDVAAARSELETMAESLEPTCAEIHFEGAAREHVHETDPREVPSELRKSLVRKFMGFVENHPPLAKIAQHERLRATVESLAEESTFVFQDMAMIKPPGGREKPWHQDHAYFNLALETRVVAAWIALSEATIANGCMHVIPGGHRDGPRVHFAERDFQLCDRDVVRERRLAATMRSGDVLLFDAKLPHGTPTNRTNDWRWALQFHYVPKSVIETDDAARLAVFGSEGHGVSC